ncbi:MAG: tetratricopeptide repeat protein [Verrucomicrobiaceae bacterium]|nr:MAG: tetratricopeptide repeat protein [Verrucomicrobiaceae bacterium]
MMTKPFIIYQLCAALMLSAGLFASQKESSVKVLDLFSEYHSENEEFSVEARDQIDNFKNQEKIETGALTSFLRGLYPSFGEALREAGDDPEEGIKALEIISKNKDPFLAAEGSYFLSRVLVSEGLFEQALPHLNNVIGKWSKQSLRGGESLYYQGVCYSNMLQRTAASDALNEFIEGYPDSSPRLIGAAMDLIASLERVHRGSIDDVAGHMEFSRRKLDLTEVGEGTQVAQSKIVAMLDELIEMAEEQEKPPPPNPNDSESQAQGQGGNPSGKPGNGQNNSKQGNPNAQKAPRVVRRVRGAAESAWDDLRKRDRGTDALGALKSKYPARYRLLVDQYYRSVQGEDKDKSE